VRQIQQNIYFTNRVIRKGSTREKQKPVQITPVGPKTVALRGLKISVSA
jgi:hypothetical protein